LTPIPIGGRFKAMKIKDLKMKELVEYRIVSKQMVLNDSAPMAALDEPEKVVDFVENYVKKSPIWNPDRENFIVIFTNIRYKGIGFEIIAQGTLDSVLIHARDVFRQAIVRNCSSIILAHNHPSGDCSPSDADITVTRNLIRGGALLNINVDDHIIVPSYISDVCDNKYCSLRQLGYFYS
jgi:DNA repair protein RadC